MAEAEIAKVKKSGDDFYRVLGVERDADDADIKKAYRKIALRLHPDKCSAPGAEDAFKKVSEAYSTLTDSQKRRVYDQCGVEGLRGGGGGGGPDISPEDIFQAFFGGMQPGGFGGDMGGGGGGPGFVRFSTQGGPGGGVFHFSSSGMGPGGGGFQQFNMGGQGGGPNMRVRGRGPRPPPREEEPEPETPAWLLAGQALFSSLGPLLPLVLVSLVGLAIVFMGAVLQFFMQRFMIIMPILYFTQGKVKLTLLVAVVILSLLGFC